jgi:transposase-like protein
MLAELHHEWRALRKESKLIVRRTNMGKPRRTFSREFKVEAVKLVTQQGRTFAVAVANLGIAENLLLLQQSAEFA